MFLFRTVKYLIARDLVHYPTERQMGHLGAGKAGEMSHEIQPRRA